jgi:hypothetical protein
MSAFKEGWVVGEVVAFKVFSAPMTMSFASPGTAMACSLVGLELEVVGAVDSVVSFDKLTG